MQSARRLQQTRGYLNVQLPLNRLDKVCRRSPCDRNLLQNAAKRFRFSPRAIHRVLKVARTIADLDDSEAIRSTHIAEAVNYRWLDRENV